MGLDVTDRLSDALRVALAGAELQAPDDVAWEVPRDEAHGDYATKFPGGLGRGILNGGYHHQFGSGVESRPCDAAPEKRLKILAAV